MRIAPYLFACVLLSGLPAIAQSPDPQTTPDTPRVVTLINGASDQPAPAHPAADGHIIITTPRSQVWCPTGTKVELVPTMEGAITAKVLILAEDGRIQMTQPIDPGYKLPSFSVDAPTGVSQRRMAVLAMNDQQQYQTVMQCVLRRNSPEPLPDLHWVVQGEQVHLAGMEASALSKVYVFVDRQYAGTFAGKLDKVDIDARCLSAGVHHVWTLAQSDTGILMPLGGSDVTITPRFTLTNLCPDPEVHVPEHEENGKTPIKVTRANGVGAVKTLVYIEGNYAGESDQPTFDMQLPMHDVGNGTAAVDVVGVGKDGCLYPPETLTFQVKNEEWTQRVCSTREYDQIVADRKRIDALEQETQYWYTRAQAEPAFTESNATMFKDFKDVYGQTLNTTYISTLRTPGHSPEYIANCRRAVIERAQLQVSEARLYRALKMTRSAKSVYRSVLREVGTDSATGATAGRELAAM